MHEPGSRETAVVLEGAVDLFIDGERHELGEGDSVTFDADLPHHFENNGDDEAPLPGRGRRRAEERLSGEEPVRQDLGSRTRSTTT